MAKGSSNVFFDKSNHLTVMQLPTPIINVHFTTFPWTTAHGPLRIVPGTHRNDGEMPSLRDEPSWMKKGCCLCPLPAGTAIVRDVRTWHGGECYSSPQGVRLYAAYNARSGRVETVPYLFENAVFRNSKRQ